MTLVTDASFLKSKVFSGVTYMLRAIDARLQTATCRTKLNENTLPQKWSFCAVTTPHLVFAGVLYDLGAQITGFNGAQILLVALAVAGVLVKHIRRAGFRLRLDDGVPHLLSLHHAFSPALLLIPKSSQDQT